MDNEASEEYQQLIAALENYMDKSGNGKPNITGITSFNYIFDKESLEYAQASVMIKLFIQNKS